MSITTPLRDVITACITSRDASKSGTNQGEQNEYHPHAQETIDDQFHRLQEIPVDDVGTVADPGEATCSTCLTNLLVRLQTTPPLVERGWVRLVSVNRCQLATFTRRHGKRSTKLHSGVTRFKAFLCTTSVVRSSPD
ncbi:hypothetical protein J6590_088455, partial [Homalodisca vitripennis]